MIHQNSIMLTRIFNKSPSLMTKTNVDDISLYCLNTEHLTRRLPDFACVGVTVCAVHTLDILFWWPRSRISASRFLLCTCKPCIMGYISINIFQYKSIITLNFEKVPNFSSLFSLFFNLNCFEVDSEHN